MKKRLLYSLLAALVFFLFACGSGEDAAVPSAAEETTVPTESAAAEDAAFSYAQLKFTDFLFSSGAGAWGTTLYIQEDGSFSGVYHDSEMGDTGPDYPQGTVYYCEFYGQFGAPVKIDDYTYQLPVQVLRYGHVAGSEEIIEGQHYCYSLPMGLDGATDLLLYLPGTPVEVLPLEYKQWVGLHTQEAGELPFWGLYNETQQQGFSSTDRIESAREMVQTAEEVELSVNSVLNEASTQTEMNSAAYQRYVLWDDTLNALWAVLRQVLEEDTMQGLTNEQLVWIREKEHAASDAAAEFEGGSLYPTVYYTVAADITKERVYYLLTFLP